MKRYAPTQPFPTKPPPFDQQGVTVDDVIDFTPELRQEAQDILSEYVYGPLFTPPSIMDEAPGGTKGTIQIPGIVGGADWSGAAVDPETGMLYVASVQAPSLISLVRSKHPRSDVDWVMRAVQLATGPQGLPLFKPPYGQLVAIDLNEGKIEWSKPNGDGPRDHPALAHLDLPPLGQGARVSPLVTKTLVFLGEGTNAGMALQPADSGGKMFRAYDKATGEVVGEVELPGGVSSVPMTYAVDGKQNIVVAVGWDDMPSEYVALALP